MADATDACRSGGLNAWYGESHILHGVDFDVARGRGGDAARPQRRRQDHDDEVDHGPGAAPRRQRRASAARETIGMRSDQIARAGIAFCPEERGIFACLNVDREPDAAAGGRAGRADVADNLHAVPQPEGARRQPGHQAVGRRAADAGDRPHPAHRRAPAAARRADRGPGAGDRAADRPHHPRDQGSAASPCCWSSRISASPRPSPTGTT